ncbi:MAG: L,D-transpeptidase [Cyanothece sp. SIO2G6]|nr:L,D-transpeptidase [Cyanothece sp. SIO2G6]
MQAEVRADESHAIAPTHSEHISHPDPSTVAQTSSPRPLAPAPRNRVLRLRRGPYFPDLNTLAPPFPDPIFPEIVYPIRLVIRIGQRRVYVYRGDEVHTSYPIAVGKPGWETPVGEYTVINMQEDPVWKNPFNGNIVPAGAGNPLGDRWIGFWTDGNNVIGFHGTPNEASVGQAASHGCIRMLNQDVRALYAIAEIGMPVIVEP